MADLELEVRRRCRERVGDEERDNAGRRERDGDIAQEPAGRRRLPPPRARISEAVGVLHFSPSPP
jgi:hypothetical protein